MWNSVKRLNQIFGNNSLQALCLRCHCDSKCCPWNCRSFLHRGCYILLHTIYCTLLHSAASVALGSSFCLGIEPRPESATQTTQAAKDSWNLCSLSAHHMRENTPQKSKRCMSLGPPPTTHCRFLCVCAFVDSSFGYSNRSESQSHLNR